MLLTLFDRLRRAQNQISTFLAQVMDLNPGTFYNGVEISIIASSQKQRTENQKQSNPISCQFVMTVEFVAKPYYFV